MANTIVCWLGARHWAEDVTYRRLCHSPWKWHRPGTCAGGTREASGMSQSCPVAGPISVSKDCPCSSMSPAVFPFGHSSSRLKQRLWHQTDLALGPTNLAVFQHTTACL